MISEPERQAIDELLVRTGFSQATDIQPLAGGTNNRAFRIEAEGEKLFLKIYFRREDDPRDRLGAEFSFAAFAWEAGLRSLPRPIACDSENGLGLYEFLEGRRLSPEEISQSRVEEALAFFLELNKHRKSEAAKALPIGSEACFSLAAHLACVERRLKRLKAVQPKNQIEREAADFVSGDLAEAWSRASGAVRNAAGQKIDEPIADEDRRVSPSDFGFHNAILAPNGRLRFFDFEYAGWDDPAKMVCDFFCQPAVPAPADVFDAFADAVAGDLSDPAERRKRINLLAPVYQLKWACILLNDFLPDGDARRRFAGAETDAESRKKVQLDKARIALGRFSETFGEGGCFAR